MINSELFKQQNKEISTMNLELIMNSYKQSQQLLFDLYCEQNPEFKQNDNTNGETQIDENDNEMVDNNTNKEKDKDDEDLVVLRQELEKKKANKQELLSKNEKLKNEFPEIERILNKLKNHYQEIQDQIHLLQAKRKENAENKGNIATHDAQRLFANKVQICSDFTNRCHQFYQLIILPFNKGMEQKQQSSKIEA